MNIFLMAYKYSTVCTCPDSFHNFLFLSRGKNQTQSFSLLLQITNFENPSSNQLQRLKAAILTLKTLTGSHL
jgi:hypothetical protein